MMHALRCRWTLSLMAVAIMTLLTVTTAHAADGWTVTGSAVRVKSIAFINIDVYAISHAMKDVPKTKSKKAMIEAETDKKFTWTMSRHVEREKIQSAITDGFAMNGYTDAKAIAAFTGAFTTDLADKSSVTISYDATTQDTTIVLAGGGRATVPGPAFMRAVWSLWFGKIDQATLGDQLMGKLP